MGSKGELCLSKPTSNEGGHYLICDPPLWRIVHIEGSKAKILESRAMPPFFAIFVEKKFEDSRYGDRQLL